jgi:hypothetical protein
LSVLKLVSNFVMCNSLIDCFYKIQFSSLSATTYFSPKTRIKSVWPILLGCLFKLSHPFSHCELVWELANMQISASDNYLLFSVAVKRAQVVPNIKLVFSALKSVCVTDIAL